MEQQLGMASRLPQRHLLAAQEPVPRGATKLAVTQEVSAWHLSLGTVSPGFCGKQPFPSDPGVPLLGTEAKVSKTETPVSTAIIPDSPKRQHHPNAHELVSESSTWHHAVLPAVSLGRKGLTPAT